MGILSAAPASADPSWGELKPDLGPHHTFCFHQTQVPAGSTIRSRIWTAETTLENQTNVNVRHHSNCDTSGLPQTDVMWRNERLGAGLGYSFCVVGPYVNGLCDRYNSTIDKRRIDNHNAVTNEAAQYRNTACHELGHTATPSRYDPSQPRPPQMGRHDCMRNKYNDNGSWNSHSYEVSHHVNDHINAWFCAGCTLAAEGEPR